MRHEGGFTLVEVLVAFTLLVLVVAASLSIFSQGSRVTAQMGDYAQALRLAEGHMAGLEWAKIGPGTAQGQFDQRFHWRQTARVMEGGQGEWRPLQVALEVDWQTQNRPMSLRLETLLMGGQ